MIVSIDFETRSRCPIEHGSHAYARDPSTSILCMAYKIEDGPTWLWAPGDIFPADLQEAILAGCTMRAFNAAFECFIWDMVAVPQHGWPAVKDSQWRCTAAQAANLCLPRNLEGACVVAGVESQKSKRGKALIKLLCVPQKITKKNKDEWNDDPALLWELYAYCMQDVNAEHSLAESIPEMGEREKATWLLDLQINKRGIPIDVETVNAALAIMEQAKQEAGLELGILTDFTVGAGTQVNQIRDFCNAQISGLNLKNLQKATIEAALERPDVQNSSVQKVLSLRQEGSKASTGKYTSMAATVSSRGRVHDVLLYYGANTGRWSGKKMQPHNFPRVGVPNKLIPSLISVIRTRNLDLLDAVFGRPMAALSKGLRNMIVAPQGRKFVVVDFSAIEARVLAWLAGETWKVKAFFDFDAGLTEDDNYVNAARGITEMTGIEADRQIGKVAELSLGYQGGVGAWNSMAKNYGLDLGMSEGDTAETLAREWCFDNWGGFCRVLDLPKNADIRNPKLDWADRVRYLDSLSQKLWIEVKRHALADTIKEGWRKSHPETTKFWKDVNRAACHAVNTSGPQYAGPVCFYRQGRYLFCRLPCGRNLCYVDPAIESRPIETDDNGEMKTVYRNCLRYKRARGKQWFKEFTYGGSLVENITQAVARDFLVEAMFAAERNNYAVTFHVHDEIIAEVDENFGSVEELEQIMSVVPAWGEGCPIAAAGFEGERYHK